MSTYLSVDLDYWSFYTQRAAVTRFFNKVDRLGVPLLVVGSHEQLLSDTNDSGCHHIEHIDYHSDLIEEVGDDPPADPKAGSWLSFVRWRSKGLLVWRCPDLMQCFNLGQGTTHGPAGDPLRNPQATRWAKVRVVEGLRGIPWSSVARVGVAVSFDFLHSIPCPPNEMCCPPWVLDTRPCNNVTAWDTVLPRLLKVDTIQDAWDRASHERRLHIRHR